MKKIIYVFFCLFLFASASNGEEWEGKKILLEKRDEVVSACEKGALMHGYDYAKVQRYCKCWVDYVTEFAIKYNKEQLKEMQKTKGKNFLEKDVLKNCKHHLE